MIFGEKCSIILVNKKEMSRDEKIYSIGNSGIDNGGV